MKIMFIDINLHSYQYYNYYFVTVLGKSILVWKSVFYGIDG